MPDLRFYNARSFVIMTTESERGLEWIADNIKTDAGPDANPQVGYQVYIEHRYLDDIVNGARADGLECGG